MVKRYSINSVGEHAETAWGEFVLYEDYKHLLKLYEEIFNEVENSIPYMFTGGSELEKIVEREKTKKVRAGGPGWLCKCRSWHTNEMRGCVMCKDTKELARKREKK